MNDRYTQIIEAIDRANDIAVYCHTNPDGDALCSLLAMGRGLKNLGKQVSMYCDTVVPEKFHCLHGYENIEFPHKGVHELAISVDCAGIDRLGQCMKSFNAARTQIAIDHHKSFARFGALTLVEPDASACAEIVYKLLKQMNAIDQYVAQLLFSGIVTDSGCFAYSSVTRQTHEIACELLDFGFDSAEAIYDVFRSTELNKFKLKCRALERVKFFENNKIAIITFTKEDFNSTGTDTSHTEGIISELIAIRDVVVAYALAEVGERSYKLSIRTKSSVDASDIAMAMGGGGHAAAAGCRINGYYEDIIEKIIKLAKDRI